MSRSDQLSMIASLEEELWVRFVPGHAVVAIDPIIRNGAHLHGRITCQCGFTITALRADTARDAVDDHRQDPQPKAPMSGNGNGNKLTAKEQAFVVAYIGPAKGNGTQAAKLAGYGNTTKSQGELGHRLLKKVEIRRAIDTRIEKAQRPAIASFEERDEILSSIVRDHKLDIYARVAAARELNKCHGRHSLKMIHTTRTLEEILGESWQEE